MEVYVETVNLHGLAKSEDDFKFRFNLVLDFWLIPKLMSTIQF